jgi:hypothetical protein
MPIVASFVSFSRTSARPALASSARFCSRPMCRMGGKVTHLWGEGLRFTVHGLRLTVTVDGLRLTVTATAVAVTVQPRSHDGHRNSQRNGHRNGQVVGHGHTGCCYGHTITAAATVTVTVTVSGAHQGEGDEDGRPEGGEDEGQAEEDVDGGDHEVLERAGTGGCVCVVCVLCVCCVSGVWGGVAVG